MFSAEAYQKAVRAMRHDMPSQIQSVYDPEDFVQDACVAIVAGADPTLLLRIARRRMIDAYRRPDTERLTPEAPSSLTATRPTAHEDLEAIELRENLIASVDGDDRRLMVALACEDRPIVEIASLVGRHENTVRKVITGLRAEHGESACSQRGRRKRT